MLTLHTDDETTKAPCGAYFFCRSVNPLMGDEMTCNSFLSDSVERNNNQYRFEYIRFLRGGKIRGVLDPRFLANGKRFRENRSVSVSAPNKHWKT